MVVGKKGKQLKLNSSLMVFYWESEGWISERGDDWHVMMKKMVKCEYGCSIQKLTRLGMLWTNTIVRYPRQRCTDADDVTSVG